MKCISFVFSVVAMCCLTNVAAAQYAPPMSQLSTPIPSTGVPAPSTYSQLPNTYPSYPTTPGGYPAPYPTTQYPTYPSYPGYYPGSYTPSFPVQVTPNQVTSVNQWTGGLNTANQQINNTAYTPGRLQSANNGTGRYVNRPVYNNFGQITGYQQGYVWNNSLTGQEHGQVNTVTPNGLGGVNNTATSYMTNGRPPTGQTQQGSAGRPTSRPAAPAVRVPTQGGGIRVPSSTFPTKPAPVQGRRPVKLK